MGYPTGNGVSEATPCSPARAPALALIDRQGDVVRLTESFREDVAPDGSPHFSIWDLIADPEQRLRLRRVLDGSVLHAEVVLATAERPTPVQADAVLDAAVIRHAFLTVAEAGRDLGRRVGSDALLSDPSLDGSPAIVWIKDLRGRYLRVNRRYCDGIGVDGESITGKTDAELSPAHVVDNRRLLGDERDDATPVQLEYVVEAFAGRPALTVLRFPVRDLDGAPIATCRVAAPAAEAAIARAEGERLLRTERWARLSDAAIRAEVLEDWRLSEVGAPEPIEVPKRVAMPARGVPAAPDAVARPAVLPEGPAEPASAVAARAAELARVGEELKAERAARAGLESSMEEARAANAELEARLGEERAARAELEAAERGRVAVLEAALETEPARVSELEAARSAERAGAEQALGDALARAERAEAAADEMRMAAAQAAAAVKRANAAAELSRARAEGLETALASARRGEAETRGGLDRALGEIASLREDVAEARAETERACETARRAASDAVPAAVWEEARAAARQAADRLEREGAARAERSAGAPQRTDSVARASGPVWSHGAQRSLALSLAGASEWRTGLKDALRILGSEGGWDVVVAWCTDERANALRCAAMWTSAPDQLGRFETATWQRRPSLTASEVGRAAACGRSAWLVDLAGAGDAQIAAAASEGMRAALVVPIRHGAATSGVLELLTRTACTPDPEIVAATEAVALQLAHFDYLLRRGAEPHWKLGRM